MTAARAGEATRAFSSPPHLVHPSQDLACWLTDPPGAVIQIVRSVEGTRSMTDWVGREAQQLVVARFPDRHDLTFVLDLTLMTGREASARNGLVEPAKRIRARVGRSILLPPRNASRVYLASLYAATALLSAFGVHVEIEHSLDNVLTKYGLRAAPLHP